MAKWFHTRIREARERDDLSQAELAEKLGVTAATISNWENRVTEPWDEQRERVMAWLEKAEGARGRARKSKNERDEDDSTPEGDAAYRALETIYEEWPQSRIAEALSVSQATVSNWLRTANINPKYFEALRRLESQLAGPDGKKAPEGGVRADVRDDATPYAEWLRTELDRAGLNAVELAQKSGIHVNTILALLEGRTERPQQRTRQRIENALQGRETAPAAAPADDAAWYYIGLAWNNDEIDQVPDEPGVYMIHDRLGRPAYIGVAHKGAGGIRSRLKEHNKLRWTIDQRVAFSFSYALTSRMPSADPSQLARAIEKLLIKFMGNAILINEKDVEDLRG